MSDSTNPTVLPCARSALRRAVRLPATLLTPGGSVCLATIVDLSPRGACLEPAGPVPAAGTTVLTAFVPPGFPADEELLLAAEVIRQTDGGLGVEFVEDLDVELALTDCLIGLPPPVPSDPIGFFGVADADDLAEPADERTTPDSGVFALLDPADLQVDAAMLTALAQRLIEEELADEVVEILDDAPMLEDEATLELLDASVVAAS